MVRPLFLSCEDKMLQKIIDQQLEPIRGQIPLVIWISLAIIMILQFAILPGALDAITSLFIFGLGVVYGKVKRRAKSS